MKTQLKDILRLTIAAFLGAVVLVIHCSKTPEDFFIDDRKYDHEINSAAAKYALPPALVRALIRQESKFNPDAVGKCGEIGLMQLLPSGSAVDWARINKCRRPTRRELFDVKLNLEIGCWYLSRAIQRWKDYRHGTEMALAHYNAGEKNVLRWKPETSEGDFISRITWPGTKKYVQRIMHRFRKDSVSTLPIK